MEYNTSALNMHGEHNDASNIIQHGSTKRSRLADDGGPDDEALGLFRVEEDADTLGVETLGHLDAVREHLDGDVGPVVVDLHHRRRRRDAHHLRPRRPRGVRAGHFSKRIDRTVSERSARPWR